MNNKIKNILTSVIIIVFFSFLAGVLIKLHILISLLLPFVVLAIFVLPGIVWVNVFFEKIDGWEYIGWSIIISISLISIHLFVLSFLFSLNLKFIMPIAIILSLSERLFFKKCKK